MNGTSYLFTSAGIPELSGVPPEQQIAALLDYIIEIKQATAHEITLLKQAAAEKEGELSV